MNDYQLKLVGRARARLRLPNLDASGKPLKPEPEMPTIKALTSRLSNLIQLLDKEEPYLPARQRKKWIKEKSEIETQLGLFRDLKTWSKSQWMDYRAQFLCERGLDLDTAMMLRGKTDSEAVDVIQEKAQKQILSLQLLTQNSSTTSRAAVGALLKIAQETIRSLNYVADEKRIAVAVKVAKEAETWPVMTSEHPAHAKDVKDLLARLDVGSRSQTRIEKKGRAKFSDFAGRLTTLTLERLAEWRAAYQSLRDQEWFWERLPSWAKHIVDLPDYDKGTWLDWWRRVVEPMLDHSYGGKGRVARDYLGRFMKDGSGEPLSYRRAKMAIRNRLKGQSPA